MRRGAQPRQREHPLPSGKPKPVEPDAQSGVEVERDGAVLLLRLSRPERRNAFDLETMYAFGLALAAADGR